MAYIYANIVKNLKINYIVIRFFYKIHSYRKKKTSLGDFLIGCGAQLV
jgi:hypothetical protein